MNVLLRAGLVGFSIFLVACGGGGSGGPSPSPTPPPSPSPSPLPPDPNPSASPFNTNEFQKNWGLNAVNALDAFDDGLSGAGVVVGVIDTGVDLDQSDLDANIHPASKDIFDGSVNTLSPRGGGADIIFQETRVGGASHDDVDGHGTIIAGLIAAEKNDFRSHGLAFNAQVLAVRAEDSDSCPDCLFGDDAIAAALNYAVANGADIVNMSLGGSAADIYLQGAIEDAVLADTLIVISAGNADEPADPVDPYLPSPNPDPFAMVATELWVGGQIIIAGAIDSSGVISDFSHRAGSGQAFYLLAPGEYIYSTDVAAGGVTSFGHGSGTSFAAPAIAAAGALLMEKFPALTAAEVVDILLTSATDIGAPGVDPINGHGILNLAAAIAPIGIVSVSIKTGTGVITLDPTEGGLVVGGPFGDGFGLGFQDRAIFTDRYDRAYETGFGTQILLANPYADLVSRFEANESFETTRLALSPESTLTFSTRYDEPATKYEEQVLGLSTSPDDALRQTRFRVETSVSTKTSVSFGYGGALEDNLNQTGGRATQGTFLAKGAQIPWVSNAGLAATAPGVMSGGRRSGASYMFDGGLVLSVAASEDDIAAPSFKALSDQPLRSASRSSIAARLGKSFAGGEGAVTIGRVEEMGSVMGSSSSGVLGLGKGAETDFIAVGGDAGLGRIGPMSLSVFGHAAGASIMVDEDAGSAFSGYQGLATSQFALGLALDGASFGGNRISFTLSQPLRLEAGRVVYGFASGYDYGSDVSLYDDTHRSLVPSGRELDVELAWHLGLKDTMRVSANVLYQREPGHVASRDEAFSFMLTTRSTF